MPSSRTVLILGMHRSGTSALTRGVQMLGVHLGNNFLSVRPDNPMATGKMSISANSTNGFSRF